MCGFRAVGRCAEFDPVLVDHAEMEEKDFIDKMGVYDVVLHSDAAEKGFRVFCTRWVTIDKGSDDTLQLRVRWVVQEFVVIAVTSTSTSQRHPIWQVVIAHAARLAESEDIVVPVFDVLEFRMNGVTSEAQGNWLVCVGAWRGSEYATRT